MVPAEVLVSTYPGRLQMERQLELLRARAQLQPSDRQLAPKAVVGTAADELGTASQRYSADCSTHKIERPPWLGLAGPAHPGFPLVNLGPYRGIRLPSRRVRLPSRWCSTTVVISSVCVTGAASASPRHSLLAWASNGLRAAARAASPSPRRLGFRDASPSPQRRVARDGSPQARKHGAPDPSRVPSDGAELDLRRFSAFGCVAPPVLCGV
jgi:hypothetical protein